MDDGELERRTRALRGDREALDRLLAHEAPRLRAAVLAAGVPKDEADDAVQEAVARALAHWRDAKSEQALPAWLAAIARNVAIDWRRRRARERARSDRDEDGRALDDAAVATRPDATAALDTRDANVPAIPGVAADDLALLALRYGDGLNGREIAARLGVTYEAAKKRLQRARAEALARLRTRPR